MKTASGTTAVQIAHKEYGRIVRIEHIGSAHTEGELESLLALAMGKVIEHHTVMSIKRFVNTLRPIMSGIVTINGKEYRAEAEIPPDVALIMRKLLSGH